MERETWLQITGSSADIKVILCHTAITFMWPCMGGNLFTTGLEKYELLFMNTYDKSS